LDTSDLDHSALADLRNRRLGFVFQFHHLQPESTRLENALMPLMIRSGAFSWADRARVRGLLERVGLGDQLRERPSQKSGGQQQRAALIRRLQRSRRLCWPTSLPATWMHDPGGWSLT